MTLNVLLIEDNQADVDLTLESVERAKLKLNIDVCMDGEEAWNYLQGHIPDLILLDLNIPKIDGRELLSKIKKVDKIKTTPVIVLSSSESEIDILKSYQLQASAYIVKPITLNAFTKIIQLLDEFYFTIVRLPKKK